MERAERRISSSWSGAGGAGSLTGFAALVVVLALSGVGCQAPAPPPEPPPSPEPVAEPAPPPPAAPAFVTVAGSKVNVREAPGKGSKRIGTVVHGDRLEKLSEKDGWTEVRLSGGKSGWVASSYLGDGRAGSPKGKCTEPDKLTAELVDEPLFGFSDSGPRGDVVLELAVDAAGIPKSAKVVSNSTGAPEMADRARREALELRFVPPVRRCRPSPFTYTFTRTF